MSTETQESILFDLAVQHKRYLPIDFASKFTTKELVHVYCLGIRRKSWRIFLITNEDSGVIGGLGISVSKLPKIAAIKVAWKTRKSLIRNLYFFFERMMNSNSLYRNEIVGTKILFVFVSEENRRLGLGKELINRASIEGPKPLFVDTKSSNLSALKMYESSNFVQVRRNRGHVLLVKKV